MSQQYPSQHPNQPHSQQPYSPYAPAPEPPKKPKAGKIAGLGCLGVIALVVIAGVAGGNSSTDGKDSKDRTAVAQDKPKADKTQKPTEKPKADKQSAPVKITVKKASFSKTILAKGSNYTSVLVTVTNNSDKVISINPLYFSITDTAGTKHTDELATDENQIDTVKLAPGENISGTVTGKGTFTAKYVTYTDGPFGDLLRANVS